MIYTELLQWNAYAFSNGILVVIHKGGTGSSKTFSNLQYIINLALQIPNKVFSVVAESIPHLDRGAIRDTKIIMQSQDLNFKFNETKRFFQFSNGSILEFFSADREDIALGARRYFLYGNEINSFKLNVWDEMARRSRFVLADFNPTTEFWLEKWLEGQPSYKIFKSNYLNNKFLPENERQKIAKRAEMDSNFRKVHIDCEYGNTDDLVFNSNNIILIDEFPRDLKYVYGMDFGFIAPTALEKVGMINDDIYIDEIIYKSGMQESDYRAELSVIDKRDKIIGDTEDSRMINYISNVLGYNIFAAKKAQGSVEFGITFLQGKKLHITKRSIDTIKEFRQLTYAKDKSGIATGKYNGDDHAIDSVRYALEDLTGTAVRKFGSINF